MSLSLDAMNLYSQNVNSSAVTSKTEKLKNTLTNADSNSTDEELMDACKQFESYFLEQVFKSMQSTVMKADDSSSSGTNYTDYFNDMLVQQYASDAVETGGYGIAQMLYESMKR